MTIHPIRQDYLSGMSYAAIGDKYGIDPRTAKKYALNNLPLEDLEQRPFSSVLDPHKAEIDKWLLNGRIFSTIVHDRLVEKGCMCGYTIVNDYVQKKFNEYEKAGMYKCYGINAKNNISIQDKILDEKQNLEDAKK
jgi:hypothetical protein